MVFPSEHPRDCGYENLVQEVIQEFCVAGSLTFSPGEGNQSFFVLDKSYSNSALRSNAEKCGRTLAWRVGKTGIAKGWNGRDVHRRSKVKSLPVDDSHHARD